MQNFTQNLCSWRLMAEELRYDLTSTALEEKYGVLHWSKSYQFKYHGLTTNPTNVIMFDSTMTLAANSRNFWITPCKTPPEYFSLNEKYRGWSKASGHFWSPSVSFRNEMLQIWHGGENTRIIRLFLLRCRKSLSKPEKKNLGCPEGFACSGLTLEQGFHYIFLPKSIKVFRIFCNISNFPCTLHGFVFRPLKNQVLREQISNASQQWFHSLNCMFPYGFCT